MKLSVESYNVVFPLQKVPELIMKECLPLIKDWFFKKRKTVNIVLVGSQKMNCQKVGKNFSLTLTLILSAK